MKLSFAEFHEKIVHAPLLIFFNSGVTCVLGQGFGRPPPNMPPDRDVMMKNIIIATIIAVLSLSALNCSSWSHKWHHKYGIIDRQELIMPQSANKLIAALEDEDPRVRRLAMKYLLKIGAPEAITPIAFIAKTDSDEKTRLYAQRVLDRLRRDSKKNAKYESVRLTVDSLEVLLTAQPEFTFYTGYKHESIVRKVGILPISIKLINLSNDTIRIIPVFCRLIAPGGAFSLPMKYNEVTEKMMFSYKGGVISTVLFAPVGVGQMVKNKKINDKICQHIRDIILEPKTIPPNGLIEACAFYNVPREIISMDGWGLQVNVSMPNGDIKTLKRNF